MSFSSAVKPKVIVVMGVSGSGKSTVGALLAERLGGAFADADDFHSRSNRQKMASGIPLTDADRMPWLDAMRKEIQGWIAESKPHVLACSALKQKYRDHLQAGRPEVLFVYLKTSADLATRRLGERQNHYMKAGMVESQFAVLEEPQAHQALTVDADRPADEIVETIGLAGHF